MKQCPACGTTYTDRTLRYCLADGSVLSDVSDELATIVRTADVPYTDKTVAMERDRPMRVDIPGESQSSAFQPAYQPTAPASNGLFKATMVVIGLGIFAVVAIAAGAFIYFNVNGNDPTPNINGKDVKTAASPTPVKDDKDELRDQIANLERQINEQKKAKQPANIPLSMPRQSTTTTTARAKFAERRISCSQVIAEQRAWCPDTKDSPRSYGDNWCLRSGCPASVTVWSLVSGELQWQFRLGF